MHRPIVKLYNKVVMTVQNIAKLKQLAAQITRTKQEENERSRKIHYINWQGKKPKWSFIRTIEEAIAVRTRIIDGVKVVKYPVEKIVI